MTKKKSISIGTRMEELEAVLQSNIHLIELRARTQPRDRPLYEALHALHEALGLLGRVQSLQARQVLEHVELALLQDKAIASLLIEKGILTEGALGEKARSFSRPVPASSPSAEPQASNSRDIVCVAEGVEVRMSS
jgi:hypothetical protein